MVLPNAPASEIGVVQALIASLGIFGLLFIVVSQTRINTLNYYLSTTNFERILSTFTRIRLPHAVWVSIVALAVFLLMLTDVFSYLLTAMIWQGVFFVGWVGVVLTHFALSALNSEVGPVIDDAGSPRIKWGGLVAWVAPSVVGIILLQATGVPPLLKTAAVPIALILSVLVYAFTYAVTRPKLATPEYD